MALEADVEYAQPSRTATGLDPASEEDPSMLLRVPNLSPDAYGLPIPEIRYRVDWQNGSDTGSSARVGWFANDKPFHLQEETPPVEEDAETPVLEVVTVINAHSRNINGLSFAQPEANDGDSVDIQSQHIQGPRDVHFPLMNYASTGRPPTRIDDLTIDRVLGTRLVIYSQYLIDLLRRIVVYYPQESLVGKVLTFYEPYQCLIHHYDQIQTAYDVLKSEPEAAPGADVQSTIKPELSTFTSKKLSLAEQRRHVQILVDFIKARIHSQGFDRTLALPTPIISFEDLWLLYRPGENIYCKLVQDVKLEPVIWEVAVVQSVDYDNDRNPKKLTIKAWQLGCEKEQISRTDDSITIMRFKGEVDPTTLDAVPTKLWDRKDSGQRRLGCVERGKRVVELLRTSPKEMMCSGQIARADGSKSEGEFKQYDGNVVIDSVGADQYSDIGNPHEIDSPSDTMAHLEILEDGQSESMKRPWAQYENIPLSSKDLTDNHFLLFKPFFTGFILSTKEWAAFPLPTLSEVIRRPDPLENLFIRKDTLEFIKALAFRSETVTRPFNVDFVRGKGAGNIVMLHGPPGVGKSYTVECIAEFISRPLMSLTVADVGTEESSIENLLDKYFIFAARWKAVLLIDEADIFLERRKAADISRNGIVSVFLRKIEYFTGMLFLTTNRIGQVDDAFISRAHIVIEYEALKDESRERIWEAFCYKLRKETKGKRSVTSKAKEYLFKHDDIKMLEWNGREIRNALQTALTLAELETHENQGPDFDPECAITLNEDHFSRVAKMSRRFKDFLHELHGRSEGQRAQDQKLHLARTN